MAEADQASCKLIMMLGILVLVLYSSTSNGGTAAAARLVFSKQAAAASFNRSSFPAGFIFGTASSAYQYEGAANEGGRGPSIWDTYTHRYPEKIKDGSNGNVAVDSYHRYKEDVQIMKEMGLDAYRFSISWSRVLPNGKLSGGVNMEGIRYYNRLIDELLANGIQPFGTLFHWDLPQALEDEYGGFLSQRVVEDFQDYAEVCFQEFGDRVKHWITLNEPWSYSSGGYVFGTMAPARCSQWQHLNCTGGDSATEPYLVTHHQLLAHAAAVRVYRQRYQTSQKGEIGITLVSLWFVPFSGAEQHRRAARRALDFMFGWFMEPLTTGEYPQSMRSLVGDRLPKFSTRQSVLLNGSFDFLGLNYYTSNYAAHVPNNSSNANNTDKVNASYDTDAHAYRTPVRNGIPIGPQAASDWLYVYPRGLRNILQYTKRKYSNPIIYITENGTDELNNGTSSVEEALVDTARIEYHSRHLSCLHDAIQRGGVDVRGYFAWSLLDNFEWNSGYSVRFGIYHVDYSHALTRRPKLSASWFASFLNN